MLNDGLANELAAALGWCVLLGCAFRVLAPLAGAWILKAIEDAVYACHSTADKLAELKEPKP